MGRKKTYRNLYVGLVDSDLARLERLAKIDGKTKTELGREAILWYPDQRENQQKADAHSRRDETQRQFEKAEEASKKDRAERDAAIKEVSELRGLSEGLKTQNAELLSRFGRDDKKK